MSVEALVRTHSEEENVVTPKERLEEFLGKSFQGGEKGGIWSVTSDPKISAINDALMALELAADQELIDSQTSSDEQQHLSRFVNQNNGIIERGKQAIPGYREALEEFGKNVLSVYFKEAVQEGGSFTSTAHMTVSRISSDMNDLLGVKEVIIIPQQRSTGSVNGARSIPLRKKKK